MSHTTASPQRPGTDQDIEPHPGGILMYLVIALLAPMFLGVTGGDVRMAHIAAVETINGYRAQSHSDLIAIAQIIAFGLAALGSLSLSMAEDISLPMTLRLRGNANALNRSAEQNRRVVRQNRAEGWASPRQETPAQTATEAATAAPRHDPAPAADPGTRRYRRDTGYPSRNRRRRSQRAAGTFAQPRGRAAIGSRGRSPPPATHHAAGASPESGPAPRTRAGQLRGRSAKARQSGPPR